MPAESPHKTPVRFELRVGDRRLRMEAQVPAGPCRPRALLPLFQGLAGAIVDAGVEQAAAAGKAVSCRAGCGACCRQLVPITEAEAHHLRALIGALPRPRRRVVRERFAAARRRLHDTGLLLPLVRQLEGQDPGPLRPLGDRYFQLGLPCPFLFEESCSIHPDRPIACREYLVTSPAAGCGRPGPDTVEMVPIAARVSNAVAALGGPRWVPLVLAPEWAEQHPEPPPTRTGPELVGELLQHLSR